MRWSGVKCRISVVWAILLASSLGAQQAGFIAGVVHDRSGGIVAATDIRVQSQETGARQTLRADDAGCYSSSELTPGSYKITVRRDGFRTISQADVSVMPGKTVRVDFVIDVLPLQQEVTVSAAQSDIDPTASGLTMSRQTPSGTLPQNGRDVHALFSIMPGATVTPASLSSGGQFTVGGQRPNANSFTVDGVSANVGMGIASVPGAILGGDLPGMTTIGGMQNLASKEETERVELRSADFSPEFGDRPGAQIIIETRAGTNDFHGSVFGYIRPHSLDGVDWFARGSGLDLPSARLNGFGGGVGGSLWRNHTYFFASFERTGVHDDALLAIAVPSLTARTISIGTPYEAILNAFPLPAGRPLNTLESLGYAALQKDASVTNRSIRVDQNLGSHIQFFARYSDVPSSSSSSDLGTDDSLFHWRSATAGVNLTLGHFVHELRFNYSIVQASSQPGADDSPAMDQISQAVTGSDGSFFAIRLSIEGEGQRIAEAQAGNEEKQLAGTYLVSRHAGKHELRAGGGYSKLFLQSSSYVPAVSIVSPGIDALLDGAPLGVTYSSGNSPYLGIQKYSAFVQDTVRITDRLQLLCGLRWDITPPAFPSGSGYIPAYFSTAYWGGIGTQPPYTTSSILNFSYGPPSLWPMRYGQVAPRVGLAYHLKSPDLVLRAGTGLFYDTALGSIVSNTNPLTIWQFVPNTPVPTFSGGATSAGGNATLSVPRVWEWKTSLEKSLGEQSLLSLSYFGSKGYQLLRNEGSLDPQTGALDSIQFTSQGVSNYNALLASVRANVTPDLYALVSYTWSHSIDTGSSDTGPILADGPSNKGSSSFDVRQVLTASFGYRTPSRFGRVLGGWTLSSTSLARTGFPFDVTTVDESMGLGFDNADRANLVLGQPIWINNGSAPGGRALNPAAFQAPTSGADGTLGRNALTGFGIFQIDTSLRRQLRLYHGSSVEASISAFNLLNHPSFANPVSYLGSALFGQSTSMTNLMLGSGSPTTGPTPLFQAGGPRTIELSLRFSF